MDLVELILQGGGRRRERVHERGPWSTGETQARMQPLGSIRPSPCMRLFWGSTTAVMARCSATPIHTQVKHAWRKLKQAHLRLLWGRAVVMARYSAMSPAGVEVAWALT